MVLLKNSIWLLHLLQGALAANIRRRGSVDVSTPVNVPSTSVPAVSPAPSSSSSSQSSSRRPIKSRLYTSVRTAPSPSVSKSAATTIPKTSAPSFSSATKSTAAPITTFTGYFYHSDDGYEGCSFTESGLTGLFSAAPSTSGQTGYQPCVYTARPTVTVGSNMGPILSTMSDGVVVSCSSAKYQDYNVNNVKECVGSSSVVSTDSSMYNSYYSSSASVAASIAYAQISAESASSAAMASPTAIVWIGETWEYKDYSTTEKINWMAWVARNDDMSGYADWCDDIVSVKKSNDYVQSVEGTPMPETVSFKKSSVDALKDCTYASPTIGQVEAGNLTCTGSDRMNIPCTTDFPTFSNYNTTKKCSKKSWSIGLVLACPISESSHEGKNVQI
ncbi:uncharacterized protein N7459_002329 [Penicillium hispanicum]|uniref:uncharacterized protein n=1 Tax=Penicillium hispanicum TaxID=1080232 RepID=UPI002541BC54|nr:uncharacterized protein N7459_002329 [Penicillium hispanicum]KAJ5591960.1 hypothetical protein N7459_002329 [Penicillium hispanicum]